jgi:myo-inositol 2-dehydrogenase/D-chiro-inositol 1-dehydrogenase
VPLDTLDNRPQMKVVLVGAGRMGRNHARALAQIPGSIQVVAVVDPRIELARGLARTVLVGAEGFADLQGALGSVQAEAVIIAAPTPEHERLVDLALERHLHVLCEKPLTFDPVADIRLTQAAAGAGLRLQVGLWRRFARPWRECREAIRAGGIGQLLLIRTSQLDQVPPPIGFCDRAVSGGLIVDCGVHEFDMIEWLSGVRIRSVRVHPLAVVSDAIAALGDCDNVLITCELDGGTVGLVHLTRNVGYADDIRTEVFGSHGAAFMAQYPAGTLHLGSSSGYSIRPMPQDILLDSLVEQILAFVSPNANGAATGLDSARALAVATAAESSRLAGGAVIECPPN